MKLIIYGKIITFIFAFLPGLLAANLDTDFSGIWTGSIKFPAFEYRIIFVISNNTNEKDYIVFPDQSEEQYEVELSVDLPNIKATSKEMKISFNGVYSKNEISGIWKQMNREMPLSLHLVDELILPVRPQTPEPPFPYKTQEVVFGHDDLDFNGTLTIPDSLKTCSAIILVPGVGTHDRDNTFFGHKPFFVIADYLTRRGIAVLRYDEIPGRVTATTADFAADVNSAVRYLKEKEYVNNIGILGHSEGGLIAALAAAEFPDIAYIILMASPGLKGDIYNCQFEASMGKAMGLSDFEIERKLQLQRAVIAAVLKSTSDVEAEDEIRKLYYNFDNKISSSQIDAAIQRFLSPWFKYSIKSDPGLVLQKVICPVLAIFGEKDWQVPPEGNMEAVIDALKETGNTDYKVIVMAEHNHYMQNASTGKPDEYDRIEETISEDVLRLISSWILERQ